MTDRREAWDVPVAAAIGGAIGTGIALAVGMALLPCAIIGGALVSFLAYRPGEIRAAMRTMRSDIVAGAGTFIISPRIKAVTRKCCIVLWGVGMFTVGSCCYALLMARHPADDLKTPFALIGAAMLLNGFALFMLLVCSTVSVYLCKHTSTPAWPLQRFVWRRSDYVKPADPRGVFYNRYPYDDFFDAIETLFKGEAGKDSPYERWTTLIWPTLIGVWYSAIASGLLIMIVVGLCVDALLTLCLTVVSRSRLAAASGGAVGTAVGAVATTLAPVGIVSVLVGAASGGAAGRVFARVRTRIVHAFKPAA